MIYSVILDDWGGSEELWAQSIPHLQAKGCEIIVLKNRVNLSHPQFIQLQTTGVKIVALEFNSLNKLSRLVNLLERGLYTLFNLKLNPNARFIKKIRQLQPDLVIVAQGINFDGLLQASELLKKNIPYTVICQKAVDFYWPHQSQRAAMKEALLQAQKVFFVSKHNLKITEDQFGTLIPNHSIVFNPVKISGLAQSFPDFDYGIKLACIGRLFLIDKGQDILIRVLAKEKWRNRPLHVSFFGAGDDELAIREMIDLYQLTRISFEGYTDAVSQIWEKYHGLILPSRSEGLPLVMIEAMAAGRVVIVSNAGGNAEIVEDTKNGFIGHANEDDFDQALERAWEMRDSWPQIGQQASAFIKKHIPENPEKHFGEQIIKLITK